MSRLNTVVVVLLTAICLGATAFVSPPEDGETQGIKFFKGTWAQALAKAKAEKKMIFMDAYTSWCGPCKMMQARSFPNKEVGDYFNKKFVSVKIDMEEGEGPSLAETYGVTAYPTLFFIDVNGKVVKREMGFRSAENLLSLGKTVGGK
jgi:thioredoxin 1